MGPTGQGGDFMLSGDPNSVGYDYQGGNFFGSVMTDSQGDLLSTSGLTYDAASGTYVSSGGDSVSTANGGDTTAAAAASMTQDTAVSNPDVVTDINVGNSALQLALGDISNLTPGAGAEAGMALSSYQAAEAALMPQRSLSPEAAAKVDGILAMLHEREMIAQNIQSAATGKSSKIEKAEEGDPMLGAVA
jgi:hypothetical protein